MLRRPLIAGFIAADSQLALFVVLVTALSGWETTQAQFSTNWYYLVALAIGFGVQVGLYVYLRDAVRRASRRVVAATGTTSTLAMVSCCAHYLVNILPALGATTIATFVGQYQTELFWVALTGNAAGIAYLGRRVLLVRRHQRSAALPPHLEPLRHPNPLFGNAAVVVAFIVVVGATWFFSTRSGGVATGTAPADTVGGASTQTNNEGTMTVIVTPKRAAAGSWEFEVQIDNHVQEVSQDMVAVSSIITPAGVTFAPSAWQGDPPGGHHRTGTLTFDSLPARTTSFTLTIRELGGVATHTFTWDNLTS